MPKLREYKGVTYRDGAWIDADSVKWTTATDCLYHNSAPRSYKESKQVDLTDDDHAALMDLKNNPYEPIQTLEDVIDQWSQECSGNWKAIRDDLCKRIREAFPDIDKPFSNTLGEKTMVAEYNTVQDHVDALVRMGAWEVKNVTSLNRWYITESWKGDESKETMKNSFDNATVVVLPEWS